jgi:uncharacterized protein YjbJ (UPF0337 family)
MTLSGVWHPNAFWEALVKPYGNDATTRLPKENRMNWDVVKGNWKQLKGKFREEWGDLTDNEYEEIAGNKDQLVGKLQERYGWTREEADRRADAWATRHYMA